MEFIWSPWRYQYVTSAEKPPGCVFCRVLEDGDNEKNLILHRAPFNFVILNRFPYTSGHLMIVPYKHESSLLGLDQATSTEMMELAKLSQKALAAEYNPDGFNIGLNLGKCAGAGIADHVHLHVVPRWTGDASFVYVISETRILPEELDTSFKKLSKHFSSTARA